MTLTDVVLLLCVSALIPVIGVIAFRMRRATRYLMEQVGRLDEEINGLREQRISDKRELWADVASMLTGGKRVPFSAQHNEDIALWHRFRGKEQGLYVEVGAYDGVSLSNTLAFEALGWSGVLIEANPQLYEACARNRPRSTVIHAAVGAPQHDGVIRFHCVDGPGKMLSFVDGGAEHQARVKRMGGVISEIEVPHRSLDSILDEAGLQGGIDFVTIDVEGSEIEVLKGFDLERWRPEVLVVENNRIGADTRVLDYLSTFNYRLIDVLGCNEIFAR